MLISIPSCEVVWKESRRLSLLMSDDFDWLLVALKRLFLVHFSAITVSTSGLKMTSADSVVRLDWLKLTFIGYFIHCGNSLNYRPERKRKKKKEKETICHPWETYPSIYIYSYTGRLKKGLSSIPASQPQHKILLFEYCCTKKTHKVECWFNYWKKIAWHYFTAIRLKRIIASCKTHCEKGK